MASRKASSLSAGLNPFSENEPSSSSSDGRSHPYCRSNSSLQNPFDESSSDSRPESRVSRASVSSLTTVTSLTNRSISTDLPERVFNFFDATVNLPAVLNDPRKPRPVDFLTRTWGEGFVECPVRASLVLDQFGPEDFRPYLRCVNIREALLKGTRSAPDQTSSKSPTGMRSPRPIATETQLASIPPVFFAQSFAMEQPVIFKHIYPFSLTDRDAKKSMKAVHDKCTQWLDTVENEIARNVALRAESFFSVVSNHDLLEDRMDISLHKVVSLRKSLWTIGGMVKPAMRTVALAQKRHHLDKILQRLQTISTINQTQLTIQMLLANGDFVGALDLITTTRDILSSDLAGIHCFRHLSTQLTEIEKFIDKMMSSEFRRALSAHLNRSFDITSEISVRMIDEERFGAIITALLRQRRFNVVDWFREETLSALQATLKYVLISSLSEERDEELEDRHGKEESEDNNGLPYHLLKSLDFQGLVKLFRHMKNPLKEILLRIRVAHDVAKNLDVEALSQESRAGVVDESGLTATDFSRLATQLQELLFAVGEETQEQIAKILNKSPGWRELRLHNDDLVSLWDILQEIMKDAEAILGIRMTVLNAQLQKLAFAFVGKFHEDRKQKLTLILDSERWVPTEVPLEFQAYVDTIISSQTFRVAVPRQPSKDSMVPNGEDSTKQPSAVIPYLEIQDEFFVVVGTVVILLKMLGEYAALSEKLPSSMNISGDILQKIVELLKMFNSRTCQLVLGAGAMHSAGLRSITSKNLTLSSRCLQLIEIFIPIMRDDLAKQLPAKQGHLMKNFDSLQRDIDSHIEEIEKKLLQIFDAQLIGNFARWEATVPVPSQAFQTIFIYVKKLYDAVNDLLPQAHLERLFKSLFVLFKRRLKQQLAKLMISNDNGPQHGIVTAEVSYFRREVHSLVRLRDVENFDDVWER